MTKLSLGEAYEIMAKAWKGAYQKIEEEGTNAIRCRHCNIRINLQDDDNEETDFSRLEHSESCLLVACAVGLRKIQRENI